DVRDDQAGLQASQVDRILSPFNPRGRIRPAPFLPLPMPRIRWLLAMLVAAVASAGARPTGSSLPAPGIEPSVIVDFSSRDSTYRVTGDASLLSQRFTPGTTLNFMIA